MAEKKGITAETSFKEWYTTPGTGHVTEGAKAALRLVGKTDDGEDQIYKFHKDTFTVPYGPTGAGEPRELVVAYAVYRRVILRLAGEPGDYERPIAAWKNS